MVRPRLKSVMWERDGDRLRLAYDFRAHFSVDDPDGTVEILLELLRTGGRTIEELSGEFEARGRMVSAEDIASAVKLLDGHRLVEDENRLGQLNETDRERHFSNLAFFESFATLERSREDLQQMLRDAHVVVLGAGGLSSNSLPHLCGLGVGRLTLLDRDTVEIRNFARQYLYRHRDVGESKVRLTAEWVKSFDPTIAVTVVEADVTGETDVRELLDRDLPDAVLSGIDTPGGEVDEWVNAACVRRGVPFVRGGMYVTQAVIYSVDPGSSACLVCSRTGFDRARAASGEARDTTAAVELVARRPSANRGIGPVAGILGGYAAFEVLRYITRIEPPAYAACPLWIDLARACATSQPSRWQKNAACPVCGAGASVERG